MTYVDVDPIVELAFGADLAAGPNTWEWTDVSADLVPQALTITRGRADESSRSQAGSVGFELDNPDGRYTPDNARSPHFPHVGRGTPCRVRVPDSVGNVVTGMRLSGEDGTYASAPDDPSLRTTGSMSVRFDGRSLDWRRGQIVAGRVGGLSDLSWFASVGFERRLYFNWSPDGTEASRIFAGTTIELPAGAYRQAWRIDLVADDGAGEHEVVFYTAPTMAGPWVPFGDPVQGADSGGPVTGTTSVWAGTAALEIGSLNGGGHFFSADFTTFAGDVYGFELYDDTTRVAAIDFTTQELDADSIIDDELVVWTLHDEARIVSPRVRFVGQVDGITPSWPFGDLSDPDDPETTPGEARVTFSASGTLRRLGQGAKPLASSMFRAVTRPEPEGVADALIAYWPMEDGSDATHFASPVAGVGPVTFGGELRPAGDSDFPASDALPSVGGGQPFGWIGAVPERHATDWMVTKLVRVPTGVASPSETPLLAIGTTGQNRTVTVHINTTSITMRGLNADGGTIWTQGFGPVEFFDGETQVFVRAVQEGGSVRFSLGWLTIGGNVFGGDVVRTSTSVGRVTSVANLGTAPPDGMSFGHVAVTTGVGAGWLGWVDGANAAYLGEPAGVRIKRLCDEEGVPVRIIGPRDDTARMGPQGMRSLPELLQECADVDMGVLNDERDGIGLVYRTRASLYNQAPALALDARTREEDDVVTCDIVNPFVPTLDDQRLRNDITVKREGGSSARAVTDPPPPQGELYDEELTLNVDDDVRLSDQAGWRLHLGTWAGMRYPSVTSELSDAPHLIDSWLAVELGDRVTVDHLPPQHPVDTVDLLGEGYTETIAPHGWEAAINCSPGGPYRIAVREDDDDEPARRDTAGSELDADVTSDAALMFVAVTLGPRWTVQSADFPFDIDVGGEQVRVTDISFTTSPQWFTVVRSVNGVVKAHDAGTPVRLWQPTYRAL